jgi:hypothetical protein
MCYVFDIVIAAVRDSFIPIVDFEIRGSEVLTMDSRERTRESQVAAITGRHLCIATLPSSLMLLRR